MASERSAAGELDRRVDVPPFRNRTLMKGVGVRLSDTKKIIWEEDILSAHIFSGREKKKV